MRNFWQICRKIIIYTVKKHFKYEICQRKFGRVHGRLNTHKIFLNPLQKVFNTRISLHPPSALWFAISCPFQSIKNGILHTTCTPPKIFPPLLWKNNNPPLVVYPWGFGRLIVPASTFHILDRGFDPHVGRMTLMWKELVNASPKVVDFFLDNSRRECWKSEFSETIVNLVVQFVMTFRPPMKGRIYQILKVKWILISSGNCTQTFRISN